MYHRFEKWLIGQMMCMGNPKGKASAPLWKHCVWCWVLDVWPSLKDSIGSAILCIMTSIVLILFVAILPISLPVLAWCRRNKMRQELNLRCQPSLDS